MIETELFFSIVLELVFGIREKEHFLDENVSPQHKINSRANWAPQLVMSGSIVIYKALCFDVAQGQMNGAPNETRTHSYRFASLAC